MPKKLVKHGPNWYTMTMIGADRLQALKKKGAENKQYMHSPDHQLADELAKGFGDMKHFGFYLKLATKYNHDMLRKLAQEVREQRNVKNPARLFVFLVKKQSENM